MLKLDSISGEYTFDPVQLPVLTLELVSTNKHTDRDPGLLTKNDIKAIKFYVKKGMALPTKIDEVKVFVKYQKSGIAGLEPTDIQELFQAIVTHTLSWDSIERKTFQQAIDLQNYATKIVITGTDIIDLIDKMEIRDRLKKLGTLTDKELKGITYSNNDKEVGQALGAILELMKADIAKERIATAKLKTAISNFRVYIGGGCLSTTTDDGKIEEGGKTVLGLSAQVTTKKDLMDKNNLSAKIVTDEKKIGELNVRIENLEQDYKKYRNLAFSGAWALGVFVLTASIFGPKAKKAREDKEQLIAELAALESKVNADKALQKAIEGLATTFKDLGDRLDDAGLAVEHLNNMWTNIYTSIDNSHTNFMKINDAGSLIEFLITFKTIIDPWKEVGPIATNLEKIIDEALKEWKIENP